MAFSSWRLPKVNFGKLPKSRQIYIWRDLGRAVLARLRGPSTCYSYRLLIINPAAYSCLAMITLNRQAQVLS